jgi:hypothetical protein
MPQAAKKPRCVFCDRKAVAGWVDARDRLTTVCRWHKWIAVAACGSAQAEYVKLDAAGMKHSALSISK